MSVDFMRASLASDRREMEGILRATVPPEWPDIPEAVELRLSQVEAEPALESWLLRAMVRRSARVMVGHIGFHGAPAADDAIPRAPCTAEFGYEVFQPFRRQGYAREASVAMMDWARERGDLERFVLSISPDNVASQALAAHLGFVRIGSQIDEVDGLEDVLERWVG